MIWSGLPSRGGWRGRVRNRGLLGGGRRPGGYLLVGLGLNRAEWEECN